MAELNFDIKSKFLKINGKEYEIKCSDLDIADRAAELQKEFKEHEKDYDATSPEGMEKTVEYIHKTRDLIDLMLGEGAMQEITEGKPVGVAYSLYMLKSISEGVAQAFNEEMEQTRPKRRQNHKGK